MSASNQGSYIDAITSLCSRYPDLIKLKRYLEKREYFLGRAAVLQFDSGRHSKVERFDFRDADALNAYFSRTAKSTCRHRLYLLEDLSRPFVEAFGAHFWMDPFLFAAQENATHWTASYWDFALPRRLPSLQKADPLFTLRYYEVVKPSGNEDRGWAFTTVSNVDRKIEPGHSSRSDTYVIRRNASFWSRVRKDGGWDALILADPPIGDSILVKKNQKKPWRYQPYGFGYVDFTPWNGENARLFRKGLLHGPPRTSMFDDIAWYWTQVASAEQVTGAENDMAMSAMFLKKIVASHWNVLLEYVWANLSEFEKELGEFEKKKFRKQQEQSDHLAETLAGVNLFRRRLSWYFDEVESSLASLEITVGQQSNDEGKELLSILARLQGCKDKVESMMPIVTGMLSICRANISLEETRLVSKLTVVALVFIPLSFTASIFSMGGDYQPGSSHFWVYFSVALPMTLIILAIAWWMRGKLLI